MRPRPNREIAAKGLGHIGQVNDGKTGEIAAVHAFGHAIHARAHAVEMPPRFGRVFADDIGKPRRHLRALDGLLQVALSHQGFGEGTDRAVVEQVHNHGTAIQFAAKLRGAMLGHILAIRPQRANRMVDSLPRRIHHRLRDGTGDFDVPTLVKFADLFGHELHDDLLKIGLHNVAIGR